MERHFDEALQAFKKQLLHMAALTEKSIQQALEALTDRDTDIAEQCIQKDQQIDELEIAIEEQAIELLALFQPLAQDLRYITTGMRINTEVERIADLVVNICQRVKDLAGSSRSLDFDDGDIAALASIAQTMVHRSLNAFVRKDEHEARDVILADQQANDLRSRMIYALIHEGIAHHPDRASEAVALILITRDLERICDQAKFIAEDVIYLVRAEFVKHHPERLSP